MERGISPVGRTVSVHGLITTEATPEDDAVEWSEDGGEGEDAGWGAGPGGDGAPGPGGARRVCVPCALHVAMQGEGRPRRGLGWGGRVVEAHFATRPCVGRSPEGAAPNPQP